MHKRMRWRSGLGAGCFLEQSGKNTISFFALYLCMNFFIRWSAIASFVTATVHIGFSVWANSWTCSPDLLNNTVSVN